MALSQTAVARLFSAAITLGIRPEGYYRTRAVKFRNDAQKSRDFIQHETSHAAAKLQEYVVSKLRKRGVKPGVQIKMDWLKFVTEPAYRSKKLQVTGVHAIETANVLRTLGEEIDAKYAEYSAQADEFRKQLNPKKKKRFA